MNPIYIPQLLRVPQNTETLEVQDYLDGLETLTPVNGYLRITHHGNYLNISGQAETIVTLTCDRCLQQYNYRLAIEPTEIIWLEDTVEDPEDLPLEREITLEELVETLPTNGYFHPDKWLYEQLCLEIPQRKLCDQQCSGIPIGDTLPIVPSTKPDGRWASLEALKQQLPKG